jgi:hypothetical protein
MGVTEVKGGGIGYQKRSKGGEIGYQKVEKSEKLQVFFRGFFFFSL